MIRLPALVRGTGRDVVLIHGWGGQAGQWAAVLPPLATRYRVHAVTLPGGPGAPPPSSATPAALGTALAEWLELTDLRDVLLVGHSMGGPVALEAAARVPDRVAGLLGLDTLSDRDFYGGRDAAEIAARRQAFGMDVAAATRAMLRAIAAPDTAQDLLDALAEGILSQDHRLLLDFRDGLFTWQVAPAMAACRVPLRLLNSAAVGRAAAADPIDALRDVPVRIYGEGHFPMAEMPDHLAFLLMDEFDQFG